MSSAHPNPIQIPWKWTDILPSPTVATKRVFLNCRWLPTPDLDYMLRSPIENKKWSQVAANIFHLALTYQIELKLRVSGEVFDCTYFDPGQIVEETRCAGHLNPIAQVLIVSRPCFSISTAPALLSRLETATTPHLGSTIDVAILSGEFEIQPGPLLLTSCGLAANSDLGAAICDVEGVAV